MEERQNVIVGRKRTNKENDVPHRLCMQERGRGADIKAVESHVGEFNKVG